MQKLQVFGANKLKGQINISGSKNASLPILAATLLSNKKVYLNNLPKVKDIETMINLLQSLGSKIKFLKPRRGERYASALTKMSINNKVKRIYGKIQLKDYVKSIVKK